MPARHKVPKIICKHCGRRGPKGPRGLSLKCYDLLRQTGEHVRYQARVVFSYQVLPYWYRRTLQEASMRQIATELNMKLPALEQAISRARRAGDPRAIKLADVRNGTVRRLTSDELAELECPISDDVTDVTLDE